MGPYLALTYLNLDRNVKNISFWGNCSIIQGIKDLSIMKAMCSLAIICDKKECLYNQPYSMDGSCINYWKKIGKKFVCTERTEGPYSDGEYEDAEMIMWETKK